MDVYITDELIGTEENVNRRGELVVVENRERRINLEVGDESGFTTLLQVPLRQEHQAILPGDAAELLVVSNRPDLERIAKVSDIFIPRSGIWVSDYPYLRRDEFEAVSRKLEAAGYVDAEEDYDKSPKRRFYTEAPRQHSSRLAYDDPYNGYDEAPRGSSSRSSESFEDFDRADYQVQRPRKRIPKTGANGNKVYRRVEPRD